MTDETTKITGAEEVRWDLSRLYSGVDDPMIDTDLNELTQRMRTFYSLYKGRLVDNLGVAILDLSRIEMLASKVMVYLSLISTIDVTDAPVKAKLADVQRILNDAVGEFMEFFHIELVAIDDVVLEGLYENDPMVMRHKPWIKQARLRKPHLLTEEVEAAVTKRSAFGDSAWSDFFDEMETDLRVDVKGEKKTLTEALHVLKVSKDANERAEVLAAINNAFAGTFAKYSAQTLHVITGLGAVDLKERKYEDPMQSQNLSNQTPASVVMALHKAVKDVASPLAQRYYRLKARHLNLPILGWGDRLAPMPFSDTTLIPFGEAKKLVLEAYGSFSPTLQGLVARFFDENRIDAPADSGRKQSGAYCSSSVLPNNVTESFVLLNYLGSSEDVMTLAHELGHGVHGFLAGDAQGVLMHDAPIAFCETASIFGEMTTFNFLKKKLIASGDKQSLLALLMTKIDEVINTVVRQISFSNFERRIHGADATYENWSTPQKLSAEQLDEIWLQVTREFYGEEGDVFTYVNVSHLWSYIPHFHRPFYVYGYAFGELLTQSIYAQREAMGDTFEPLYLDMLRSGGTRNVVELLAPFGLDPNHEEFWTKGIECGLGKMIDEAEALSKELGLI